jgi:hypothetical protein
LTQAATRQQCVPGYFPDFGPLSTEIPVDDALRLTSPGFEDEMRDWAVAIHDARFAEIPDEIREATDDCSEDDFDNFVRYGVKQDLGLDLDTALVTLSEITITFLQQMILRPIALVIARASNYHNEDINIENGLEFLRDHIPDTFKKLELSLINAVGSFVPLLGIIPQVARAEDFDLDASGFQDLWRKTQSIYLQMNPEPLPGARILHQNSAEPVIARAYTKLDPGLFELAMNGDLQMKDSENESTAGANKLTKLMHKYMVMILDKYLYPELEARGWTSKN